MTVSHAHARNACAHEQSTNIESGAVQWHKQLAERATFATKRKRSEPPLRQTCRKAALLPQAKCMRFHPLVILSNVEGSSEAKRKKQRAVCA